MRWIFSLLTLCCLMTVSAQAQQPPILAIFSIENKGTSLTAQEIDNLTDYLSTKLGERGRFQIVPRSEIRKRLLSQKTETYKECYDASCQVELGRELAAEQSLATSISRVGSKCLVQAQLFDLKRSTSLKSASTKRSCDVDDMLDGVEELAAKLDGSWKAPQPQAEPQPPPPPREVVVYQPAPRREKSILAALAWSILPGGGLYYTDHWFWGICYSLTISAGLAVTGLSAGDPETFPIYLGITLGLYGLSMLHATLAAWTWEDPRYAYLPPRDFRPVEPEERPAAAPALVLPVWQTRF